MKVSKIKYALPLLQIICVILFASACTNINELKSNLNTTNNNPAIIGSSTTVYTHTLSNINVVALSGSTSTMNEVSMSMNTALAGYQPLTQFCQQGSTTLPCVCELKWTAINTVGGGSTTYERTRRAALSVVQSGLAKCQILRTVYDEIPDGTSIRINVIAVSPNTAGLNAKSILFKKGSSTSATGDFVDDTLTPFRNILRYTCASKRTNTYEILNKYEVATPDSSANNPPTYTYLLGSQFCGTTGANCANPRSGPSAQSYYRNLYVRSDKVGQVNNTNPYFRCEQVEESLSYSAGQSIPSVERGKFWPFDATFALATTGSADWSVPVRAGTTLFKQQGDPNSNVNGQPERCSFETQADDSKYLSENSIINHKCLGYAKKPKVNGSCGSLTDSNGRVRPMTRLRRYRAVFPPTFQFNGGPDSSHALYADEVYVADRLVVDSSGVPTGSMIYGPKPCNYAWFDHEGVTARPVLAQTGRWGAPGADFAGNFTAGSSGGPSAIPSYVSTSKYEYHDSSGVRFSVNPDGRVLPNRDKSGTVGALNGPSCSSTVPMVEDVLGSPSVVHLITSNVNNPLSIDLNASGTRKIYLKELHVNPTDPWTPNYIEDTSFQACAPIADPYIEPPLQFYKKDANTMGWCAKVYPTQNPYWTELNSKKRFTSAALTNKLAGYTGSPPYVAGNRATVKHFTSHVEDAAPAAGSLDAYNKCELNTSTIANQKICTASGTVGAGTGVCTAWLDAGVDENGAFNHDRSCDRTPLYAANSDFKNFPLQARDEDVNAMLSNDLDHDRTYSCQYSVNADATKIGRRIPTSGCCGVINGNAVLKSVINGTAGPTTSHLEPFLNSTIPNIRFCGNPVE